MDLFSDLAYGFGVALSWHNLLFCTFGVTLGTFIGVLPGIGPLTAIAMLLPITFYLEPTTALVMLAGIYYGAQYGGSTASILLNLPGTPAAAVICMDGHAMTRNGRAGVALFMSAIGSFVGASFAIVMMTLFSPVLANFALKFTAPEYFSMILLGLVAASTLSSGSPLKGLAMVTLGVLLGLIGTDVSSGQFRFTFGIVELTNGLSLVTLGMGMFGIAEVLTNIGKPANELIRPQSVDLRSLLPTRDELRRSLMPMVRGSLLGAFFGALPGAGSTIAAFVAYAVEKRSSSTPERFGHGAIEGVVSPGTADNAAAQAAFIPTLTLGIPGDVVMALMLGAMTIHGIAPGPRVVTEYRELFWGLIASFWIGNLILLVLNIPMIGIWVRMLKIPYHILSIAVLFFICVGVYSVQTSVLDVILVALFGVVGYLMRKVGFPPAPVLLGFLLGPWMEEHMRRALTVSRGTFGIFVTHPISAVFLAATALVILWSMRGLFSRRRRLGERPT